MCLSSRKASAIFKTRLTIVTVFIKPKFQSIRLNSIQQNYAAATSISLSMNSEAGRKCYPFKGTLCKDITKQDSQVKSYNSQQFVDSNMPLLERSRFLSKNSSNLKNKCQIHTTSRSFSLQSTPPSSPKKSSLLEPQAPSPSQEVKLQSPPSNEVKPQSPPSMDVKASKAERLKMAFTEYGPTIMALHVAISLISFGGFYALLSGGIEVEPLLKFLGVSSSVVVPEKVPTVGTFVVTLAIHKILAPIRISISLGITPFVVRYMRSKGLLMAKTKTL